VATSRARVLVGTGIAVALLAAASVPAVLVWRDRQDDERRQRAARAFTAAWRTGDFTPVAYSGVTGAQVAQQASAILSGLTSADEDRPSDVELLSVTEEGEGRALARLRIRWLLDGGRRWEYETSTGMVRTGEGWRIEWSPSALHPELTDGQVLTASRERPERGRILGSGGQVLVTARPVVIIGIHPRRATDRRASAADVAAVVGVDAGELTKRVLAASPDAFVEAITLRRADYLAVKGRLRPIPGAVFRETTMSLAPTSGFARALLGTMGSATADIVKGSKGRLREGDLTGLSGIQRQYDEYLSGAAGLTVTAGPKPSSPQEGTSGSPAEGTQGDARTAATKTLFKVEPAPGKDLTISLDEKVQRGAEAALVTATQPAGLVAIRPSTGEVLAVANGGPNGSGYNRALLGQYPPGSTFKIATTFALLENGLTPDTPVACPPTITVGGRSFKNAEDEVLGDVAFHSDFAHSCNTAFIGAAQKITPEQLSTAATMLGFGQRNTLGVDAFMGSVPKSAGEVEHAADAIGQGKVLASPLTVAAMSAAVAAGRSIPAKLVLDMPAAHEGARSPTASPGDPSASPSGTPASPGDPSASSSGTPASGTPASPGDTPASGTTAASTSLPPDTVQALASLTAEVVGAGTGTALRGIPGEPVHGKTGTAEFGSDVPPKSHAWFTGYQGDVAFAVVIEQGGFGGKVAAPIAATFLKNLA
jgi:cell division protein FtsI/penicillin-binding protein 2